MSIGYAGRSAQLARGNPTPRRRAASAQAVKGVCLRWRVGSRLVLPLSGAESENNARSARPEGTEYFRIYRPSDCERRTKRIGVKKEQIQSFCTKSLFMR